MPIELQRGHDQGITTLARAGWYWLITLAIAIMPLAMAQTLPWKYLPFTLLFFTGLRLLWHSRRIRQQYNQARSIILTNLGLITLAALNTLWHHNRYASLGLYPQILLFLAIAAVFLLPVKRTAIWIAFSATGAFFGLVAWFQCYPMGQPRAYGLNGGPWAAIEFGMFLFALALFALNHALSPETPGQLRIFHLGCFAISVYGGVLTQSRGPILSFFIMASIVCILHRQQNRCWQVMFRRFLLFCCLGLMALIAIKPVMLSRFFSIIDEVQSYNSQTNANGAIRERMEMWRASLKAIHEYPWIGVGPNNFGYYIQEQVALGTLNPSIQHYKHPHNEYLEAAATTGIPGLLILLSVFVVPLGYFCKNLRQNDAQSTHVARCGLSLVGIYMLCGLSDNVFYRAMPHSLYFFLVLGLAMWVKRSHGKNQPHRVE